MTRINGAAPSVPFPRTNQDFLRAIAGDDWRRVHVTGFVGDPDAPPPGAWSGGPAGTWNWQTTENNYFTVSLFHGPRRLAQTLERWLVLGVDDVGPKIKAADVLSILGEPSFKIETSPGNEQWGYILGGAPITDAAWANEFIKALIRALVGEDGKDPGMRDVTRYLRLPIGHNQKAHLCVPGVFTLGFTVRGTHWDPDLKLQLTDAVCARLGVSPVSPVSPGGHENTPIFVPPSSSSSSQAIDDLAEHDLLFQAMRRLGLVTGGPRNSAMGRAYDVICPWVHEHTGRATTGAAYVPILQRFQCHHGHCQDRTGEDLQVRIDEMLREDSGGLTRAIDIEFDVVDPATVDVPDVILSAAEAERRFFARYVYVRSRDGFWDLDKRVLVKDRDLDSAWTRKLGNRLPLVGRGAHRRQMKPSAFFLSGARGRRVEGLIDWPDQPDVVEHRGQQLANLWYKLPRPLKGRAPVDDTAIQPWLDLYWHVIGQETLEAWALGEMILDWLAMVLASSVKGGWQVVLIGRQGIGKDLILLPLMRALGDRAQLLRGDALTSAYTEWTGKRLVQLSEIKQTTRGASTPHDQMGHLKSAFDPGKEWFVANPKYGHQHEVRNIVMCWLTSNDDNPLRLEEGDRRFLILDRKAVSPWAGTAYASLGDWLKADGLGLVAEWLYRRWETMPAARQRALAGVAPMTEAKRVLIAENEDPIDVWLRRCVEGQHPDPDALPDVVTVDFVVERMLQAKREGRFLVSSGHLHEENIGRRLAKLGAMKLNKDNKVLVQGRRTRCWAIRNAELYLPLNAADIAKICNVIGPTPENALSH